MPRAARICSTRSVERPGPSSSEAAAWSAKPSPSPAVGGESVPRLLIGAVAAGALSPVAGGRTTVGTDGACTGPVAEPVAPPLSGAVPRAAAGVPAASAVAPEFNVEGLP